MPDVPPKYFRFEMLTQNPDTGVPDGLFVAAYDQLRDDDLPNYHREHLTSLIDWFRKNLEKPARFNSSSSKGAHRRNPKCVSWFKDTSHEHIAKMREVSVILRDLGLNVSERTTTRPGYIVYEDDIKLLQSHFVKEFDGFM